MKTIKEEIEEFIKDYFNVYFSERNYEKVKTFLSPEIIVIGTGSHEFARTPEESLLLYKKDLEEVVTPIEYFNLEIITNVHSSLFSLVSGSFSLKGEVNDIPFEIPEIRYSFTISKVDEEWKILHLHISTANINQEENELYPLQKLVKQNEILNQKVEERTKELLVVNNSLKKSNQTKDTLLSIISHDIRSPFNSLLGFIDILKTEYDEFDSDEHKKFIDVISQSSHKIYDLVDNLLIWSNLQRNGFEYNPTPINLKLVIQKVLDVYSDVIKSKNISLINKIDKSLFVLSDEFMLPTILRNLISNSIKYTRENGSITIWVDNNEYDNSITICVKDNGIGIPSERIKTLFTSEISESSMGTNNEKGFGIGLSLCYLFAQLHGTKIWVESTLGLGSTFYFSLKKI